VRGAEIFVGPYAPGGDREASRELARLNTPFAFQRLQQRAASLDVDLSPLVVRRIVAREGGGGRLTALAQRVSEGGRVSSTVANSSELSQELAWL
jgi:hypothetical protein